MTTITPNDITRVLKTAQSIDNLEPKFLTDESPLKKVKDELKYLASRIEDNVLQKEYDMTKEHFDNIDKLQCKIIQDKKDTLQLALDAKEQQDKIIKQLQEQTDNIILIKKTELEYAIRIQDESRKCRDEKLCDLEYEIDSSWFNTEEKIDKEDFEDLTYF